MVGGGSGFLAPRSSTSGIDVIGLSIPIPKKHTLGHLKHFDVYLLGPRLDGSLHLVMHGSNSDYRFESWELAGDTEDSCEPTGLKEEDRDVCMVEAGRFLCC